jgi:DNA-binding CsgD family transcriptional regulator
MRDVIRRLRAFRIVVGVGASLAIVYLLFEEGYRLFDPRTLACAIVSVLTLVGAFLERWEDRRGLAMPLATGESLKLDEFKLSEREREFVLECLSGKAMKEIAIDHGLSGSTVRNIFSSAYRKLGISGLKELVALGARYKIER